MSRLVSSLREALTRQPQRGLFVKMAAAEVIDLAAQSFDFAVVDLEHSALTDGDALRLARHGRLLGLPVMVRLAQLDRGLVNRLLEAGAAGIQLSSVQSVAEVEELRSAMLYPPRGTRSVSLAQPMAGYGAVPLRDHVTATDDALLVAQIETATTHDPLEAILAAGPDVAFIGLTDLSVDLCLDERRLATRVQQVRAAAGSAGVVLGGFGLDGPDVRYRVDCSDIALLRSAMAGAA
jgi:4-hydroxy-2-oxoheptanedioate aldolase